MSIQDFIDGLCGHDFHVDADGGLSDDNEDCPIWAAYYERCDWDVSDEADEAEDVFAAGRALGLTTRQIATIMNAADNRAPFSRRLRKRLLALVPPVSPE